MPQRPHSFFITSKAQLKALTSAIRQEIVDVLAPMDEVPVSELAAALGRPPDALYHHLRILVAAGLLRKTIGAPNRGALYSTISPEMRIDYAAFRKGQASQLNQVAGSMLRLGARDFRKALADESVAVSGKRRELWALRKTGRLNSRQLSALVDHISTLAESVTQTHPRGQLYGVTILLTPLTRRRTVRKH